MPRKKLPPKFKYTTRKKDRNNKEVLYVVYPVASKPHPIWKRPAEETQEAVNATIAQIINREKEKQQTSTAPQNCGKFFDFWLKLIETTVSERTVEDRRSKVDTYLRPEFGVWELKEIRPVMIQMLYSRLVKKLMPNTIKKLHSVANLIFKEAVNLEIINSNPVEKVKPPKVNKSDKVQVLTLDQTKKFLEACKTSPHGTLFEFALETGMRPQEYLAIRWSDIDFKKKRVEVVRAVVFHKKGGGFYFKDTKTKSSRRTITLSESICEKLKLHREKQNEYIKVIQERLRRRYKPSAEFKRAYNEKILQNHLEQNLVFPNQDLTPFSDINLGRRHFKPLVEKIGLSSELTLYCLRHSCATILLSANVNPKIVSERLGHSSVSITLDTYSHVLPTMQQNATDAISDLLY